MVEYLWDGEMDCGWEELENKVVETSIRFKDEMLEIVAHSPNRETQELINDETMRRFVDLSRTMSEGLKMGYYHQYEDLENLIRLTSQMKLLKAFRCIKNMYNEHRRLLMIGINEERERC